MKKIIRIILIILSLIIFIVGCKFAVEKSSNIIQNIKKSELVRDITFEPYSNSDNLIILITIEDQEYGINNISYKDKNDKEITINGNGENKIAIDYEVVSDGEYVFKVENEAGEKFKKTLIIDSEYRKLIDISIQPNADTELVTEETVSIDYSKVYNSENITKQYKIGKSTTWIDYTDTFKIDSYTILNNSWQESDNETVIVYAKTIDNAKNTVTISQETLKLDLDMPDIPIITQTKISEYPIMTEYGVVINAMVSIDYGTRTDVNNLYSTDNGQTWQEYTGEFETNDIYVIAKSEKKVSGLYSSSKKQLVVSASNAVGTSAYDGNTGTYEYLPKQTTRKIKVSEEMQGKNMYVSATVNTSDSSRASIFCPYIRFVSSSGTILKTYTYIGSGYRNLLSYAKQGISIPEGTTEILFAGPASQYGDEFYLKLKEIEPGNTPSISNTKYYPTLGEYGIIQGYNTATIQYFQTSVQKLYKINDGEWQNYQDKAIRLELGEILYAKGIDKNGKETDIASYTSTLPSDALGVKGYDGNTGTYEYFPKQTTKKIKVSEEMQGKNMHVSVTVNTSNSSRASYFCPYIRFVSSSGTTLKTYTYIGSGYRNLLSYTKQEISIPKGTTEILFAGPTSQYGDEFYLNLKEVE